MKNISGYIVILLVVALYLGCSPAKDMTRNRSVNTPYMTWTDTVILYNPTAIIPLWRVHELVFYSANPKIKADRPRYTEWKLLHTDSVYIAPCLVFSEVRRFLMDSLGLDINLACSFKSYYKSDVLYGMVFNVRADYYEAHFRGHADYADGSCSSPSRIYRPGHKYDYYKLFVAVPEDFYINTLRQGKYPIPFIHTNQ